MAKFKFKPTINVDGYFTAKVKGAITDSDLGKAVKLSVDTSDTYELCVDGNPIGAFIEAVDVATADGLVLCTLNRSGYVRCQADGALTVGAFVEAAAQAAAGTAETGGLPKVSARAVPVVGERIWRVVSGNTTNGTITTGDTTVIIECI